jgi:serine protease Do
MKIGDIILAIGERKLRLARDLSLALLDSRPGETRAITLIRNGTRRIEQVALGKDDPTAGERGRVATLSLYPVDTSGKNRTFGATFSERDGSIVIDSVEEGSLAQLYGLYEGDIILAVNGQQPGDLGSLQARVGSMGGDVAVLRIQREGMGTFHVALPLTARASQERRPGDQKRFPQGPL